jgi:hypothetical protein
MPLRSVIATRFLVEIDCSTRQNDADWCSIASEFFKLDCYFNVDTGTGRLRGARVFGPRDAADVIRDALAPFEEGGGIVGAVAGRDRIAGGADTGLIPSCGLTGNWLGRGPDRVSEPHPAHQPGHVRTHPAGGRC